ncbi:NADH:ubiquinone reductase (Na(+)-transporting) subunit E [Parachlamydia acanthamoebae]|jgi:Na+-transporting NADH:ubiquinone oxidoreductase subunit E|uniref:Na(+)-translocating NADH-quinone reductase subunit E n=2 Tax=Parachlamydia acanthamoebae TaxID=83552 RepID=F8L1Q4_PARAV|nr:NADH:ubiquinone reductase (Na(+)-transporting) subunit E [Parachlamydia acanthamoebae]KIA77061.1 putative Na(+)-translocating NADH-quinone reductase subunit E [Parachlamydia acanthamoebae]CCB87209.1 putative Na(+)-translocating NADH-quinone reductase subunit E [Parachlamydia acanthamoebae UV-7]
MGDYTSLNLLGLFIQAVFIENFLLANFLGMCTYLACSTKLKTANGLGVAVVLVLTVAGILNWCVHQFITAPGALSWLSYFGIDAAKVDLNFLEFLLFISVIAGFTQMIEIIIEKVSPALYSSLGLYLPLIAVNCAILGACLFAVTRNYPFIPNLMYVFASGMGWWLAIALVAAIREKLAISNVVPGLRGMGITFIVSGLMAMAFQGFTGIKLATPSGSALENANSAIEMQTTPEPSQANF